MSFEFDKKSLIESLTRIAMKETGATYEEAKKVVTTALKENTASTAATNYNTFNAYALYFDYSFIPIQFLKDWEQFLKEEKILPNLRWMPSTHPNGCKLHRKYWRRVWPIRDRFWREHHPGDCEDCQCYLSSTDEPVTR